MMSIASIDATQESTSNRIAELFPENDSKIGLKELKQIYKELDTDKDDQVSKAEIYQLFNENKAIASIPFSEEIIVSLKRLNE